MKQSLSSLNFILKADISQFQSSMKQAESELKRTGQTMTKVGGVLSVGVTAPFVAASTAVVMMTSRSAQFADTIDEMAIRTGVSRQALQELSYVAGQIGVDFPSIEKSLAKLNKSMGDAANGGKQQSEAFAAIGVSVTDSQGRLRSMSDIFPEVIGALSSLDNETERNYLSMQLFGRGANEVITPLTELGEKGMKDMIDKAHELGIVMSDEGITSLAEFADATQSMKDQLAGVSREFSIGFAKLMTETILPLLQDKIIPAVRSVAKWFNDLPTGIKSTALIFGGLLATVGPVLLLFGKLASVIPTIIGAAKAMSTAMTVLNAVMAANPIGATIVAVAALVAAFIWAWNKFEAFRMFLFGLWESFKAVFTNLKELAKNVLGGIGDMLVGIFTFDMAKIKEGIAQLKGGFSEYGTAIADAYKNGAEKGKDLAETMDEVADGVDKVTDKTKKAIPEIVSLEDQLSTLEKTLWQQVQADDAGAAATARKVKQLQDEIKYLKEKQELLIGGQISKIPSIKGAAVQVSTEMVGPEKSDVMFARETEQVSAFTDELKELAKVSVDVSSMVQDAASSMAVTFGETMGKMITGTATVGDLFNGILDIIGGFLATLGKALIAAGMAGIAFENLISNPYAAVAAGVALVALSAVVSNLLSAGPGGSGGSSGMNQSGEGSITGIPRAARGGIVDKPTVLLAGEGSQDEAILPINSLMHTIYSAIATGNYMSRSSSMEPITVNVQVDGKIKAGEMYLMNKTYNDKLSRAK